MKKIVVSAVLLVAATVAGAQTLSPREGGYRFTDVKVLPYTYVKNQDMSSTCWAFSALSFLETEMIRKGMDSVSLSPMWIVRNAYIEKAIKYVRTSGGISFTPGGALGDPINVIKKYGIVPEEVYRGLNYGTTDHRHAELHALLNAYVGVVVRNPNKTLSTAWLQGFIGILDAYLGKAPETFTYKGRQYTPQTYAASLSLDWDDYYSFTSFTHHPYYEPFALELGDNWDWGTSYNVPLDEFMSIFSNAIDKGYSIFWNSDVSEGSFAGTRGWAAVPEIGIDNVDEQDRERWLAMNPTEKRMFVLNQTRAGKEIDVTAELRQRSFDNQSTTDDHGMHIVGTGRDQNGTLYYKVKNSWGTFKHPYGGLFYASETYVKYKTIGIIVNKNAVPAAILKKIGVK